MARGRYKGAQPIDRMADYMPYGPGHPVHFSIRTGTHWAEAWPRQYPNNRRPALPADRQEELRRGAPVTRTEIDLIAARCGVPAEDIIASLPDPALLVDG